MKIKTPKYHFTPLDWQILKKLSISISVKEQREFSSTAGKGIEWYNCSGEQIDTTQ